jgi:hypothetical protein
MRVKTLVTTTGLCLVSPLYSLVSPPHALASPLAVLVSPLHAADPASQFRAEGNEHEYNLRLDPALARYRQAVEANPNDPASCPAVAAIYLMKIAFQRGAVTADDFLGGEVGADALICPSLPLIWLERFGNATKALLPGATGPGPSSGCRCALSLGSAISLLPPTRPRRWAGARRVQVRQAGL